MHNISPFLSSTLFDCDNISFIESLTKVSRYIRQDFSKKLVIFGFQPVYVKSGKINSWNSHNAYESSVFVIIFFYTPTPRFLSIFLFSRPTANYCILCSQPLAELNKVVRRVKASLVSEDELFAALRIRCESWLTENINKQNKRKYPEQRIRHNNS